MLGDVGLGFSVSGYGAIIGFDERLVLVGCLSYRVL